MIGNALRRSGLWRQLPVWVCVLGGLLGCANPPQPDPGADAAPATTLSTASDRWVLSPGYYWQAARGHLRLMAEARAVSDWLADADTPPALKAQLVRAQAVRAFASDTLRLPRNSSYTRYVRLPGRAVVWNVVAAPADAMVLQRWCFPVTGCVGYQGFYDEGAARAHAASLPQDWDVAVYPVVAYSTLGWTNWLGGDPLLSSFMAFPEGEWARLVFHELAHQAVYVSGDTRFNESFATAVERLGGQLWLAQTDPATQAAYQVFDQRRRAFRALLREARADLAQAYRSPETAQRLAGKAAVLARVRERYQTLRAGWGGYAGYDAWLGQLNNALLALQGDYEDLVPGFEVLYRLQGHDFARFLEAVNALARLPVMERHQRLEAWASEGEAS